ncbi:MAG TPA: hypothetical protein VMZ29_15760 [Candidatus Bathyarchaeia archaeon]|nr:hypothetical protein [Candidatus Bathyarchaeia archaeon]
MGISKSDIKKYSNPDFSLLDEEWCKIKTKWTIGTTFLTILCFPFGLLGLIPLLIGKGSYKHVKMLKKRKRIDKLLELAKLRMGDYKDRLSLYALVDLKVKDVVFLLNDLYEEGAYLYSNFNKHIQKLLEILAVKFDYTSVEEMLRLLEKPTQGYHIVPNIKITSVYYLDEIPLKAKCMISSLLLDFNEDTVVACPNCGNLAKKELLAEWLEENDTCRVCDRKISIADCPIVKIRE